MRVSHRLFLLGAALCGLAACDAAPGPPSDDRPPTVSDLAFSPHAVSLSALPPGGEVAGDLVRTPVTLSVTARDPGGRIEAVRYVVQAPALRERPVAEGALAPAGADRYAGALTLELPRGEVGKYTLLVYAVDDAGQIGNDVRGLLNYVAAGSRPRIVAVENTPEVVRPPTDLTIVATVTDPDGDGTVVRVAGTAPRFTFDMFDDGRTQGDAVAGDGRFTARFSVDRATPGVQVFTFQATDRTGLVSERFEKSITIQ